MTGVVEVQIHFFVTSALSRNKCSFFRPGHLTAQQSACVLNVLEKSIFPVFGIRPCLLCHASYSLITTLTTLFWPYYTRVKDRQCTYKSKNKEGLRNNICREQTISVTNSKCLSVVLTNQYTQRLCLVILSSVVSQALLYFSTLSHKWHACLKKKELIGHKMCSDFLYKAVFKSVQSVSQTLLIIKRIQREMIINVDRFSCKIRVIIAGF